MILTKAAAQGLQAMATSAGAGSAADLGMAERGKGAARAWEGVQAAIAWALGLRPGRQIVLVLSPAEAEQLASVVGQGWGDGDHADWLGDRGHAATCRRAMAKLQAAREAYAVERAGKGAQGRAGRFEQPAEAIEPAGGLGPAAGELRSRRE